MLRGLRGLDVAVKKGIIFDFIKERRMPKEKFEDALNKLEKIVSKLEEGNISLEESLKLFEEGIRLSRFCNQKLEEAEKKVEILIKGRDGSLETRPFDPSAGSGQVPSANAEKTSEEEDDS
jgi:exodeoxyribonuclease VII small subunit